MVYYSLTFNMAFQSTLPARGATSSHQGEDFRCVLISIHAPRTGSDYLVEETDRGYNISIHAPRTGSDRSWQFHFWRLADFNPRSPHGERPSGTPRTADAPANFNPRSPHGERHGEYAMGGKTKIFQSTLPARGATSRSTRPVTKSTISIHAPRTGSDSPFRRSQPSGRISIHAPRTGSDLWMLCHQRHTLHFNPRSPHGERRISVPAFTTIWSYFNPRSPHGERRETVPKSSWATRRFQSTLPARGATATYIINMYANRNFNPRSPHGERHKSAVKCYNFSIISIHAPRTGSDEAMHFTQSAPVYFNPRSPHGERRLGRESVRAFRLHFNPRSPHGERRRHINDCIISDRISIHAPRTGSDGEGVCVREIRHGISIHAPRTGSDALRKKE